MPENDFSDNLKGHPRTACICRRVPSKIMWPKMNADQPARFQYNRPGGFKTSGFKTNWKNPLVQSDIFGFDIFFETVSHLLRYKYHLMLASAFWFSQEDFPLGNIIGDDF